MRYVFGMLSALFVLIGLFVLLVIGSTALHGIQGMVCLLIAAVLGTGAGVMGSVAQLRTALVRTGHAAEAPPAVDPHRYPTAP